ncbi:MAG TPA: ankyrin repeat domain-containing protein [Rhodanobacteraceae bacterium]|nr:ankyrin repeat domain-containing protein [Rhodanobacteraceae bacterium]
MHKLASAIFLLLLIATVELASADESRYDFTTVCRQERPLVRELWQRGLYDTPDDVDAVMVAVIDGDVAKTRRALEKLPEAEVVRWRQVAMYTAAEQGQSEMVEALLDDGTPVDGIAQMPPPTYELYRKNIDALRRNPDFAGVTIDEAKGFVNDVVQQSSPALFAAIGCNDLATVLVLLRHHADPMLRPFSNGADPFITAVVSGEPEIVQALLEHGADACGEDRYLHQNQKSHHFPLRTLADIGGKAGLPATLVKRLKCGATRQ